MSDLKYTIVSFDPLKKVLVVDFGTDGWASVNLVSPLPKNKEELEAVIRRYAPAQEQIKAVHDETELTYIDQMIGQTFSTSRFKLTGETTVYEPPTPEEIAELERVEKALFEENVVEILKRLRIIV